MTTRRTPDWIVERLAAGDFDARESAQLRWRLGHETSTDRLEAIAADNFATFERHPTARVAAQIRERLGRERKSLGQRLAWALPIAALAGAVALSFVGRDVQAPESTRVSGVETTREKGATTPRLKVYRKEGQRLAELAPGAPAFPGDLLQLTYLGGRGRFGVLFSVDGEGTVTRHLPESGAMSVELAGPGEVRVPSSYRLDDAPAFERFHLVVSDRPFVVEDALAAAAKLPASTNRLPLDPAFEQVSFLLRKVTP